MKATQLLHDRGQSLWLDNITRDLLDTGTLRRYIDGSFVTGLTSNPTIFNHALSNSGAYEPGLRRELGKGRSSEEIFFTFALEDLTRAADLFRPVYDRTNGVDGWVSLEVSPLLSTDTAKTVAAAKELFARAERPNLLIKIPGNKPGLLAIEDAIFAGVPVNVTLLFSCEQYLEAANSFLRGIERRIEAGLNPRISSVASVFVSRWDVAVMNKVPNSLKNKLGIAIATRAYQAYQRLLTSPRWQRIYNFGAAPQRLLWASTGTKDPGVSDVLYVEGLAAPFTINTMPDGTLRALERYNDLGVSLSPEDSNCEEVLRQFDQAGIDTDALAVQLQEEGVDSFVKSWRQLIDKISGTADASRKTH